MVPRASEQVQMLAYDVALEDRVLEVLRQCGGYYICPKDPAGNRLGPLVGYAGKYHDETTKQDLQFVGDVYYNFAKAEQFPHVLDRYADFLASIIEAQLDRDTFDRVLGAPWGGICIGMKLAEALDCQYGFADKEITALRTATSREQSKLVFGRHEVESGSSVLIVEDVCNNFSTTAEYAKLIEEAGTTLRAIACELNRSPETEWNGHPVVSLVHKPTAQYWQDDPAVAADVAKGNVVWKVKAEWPRLAEAMATVT